MVCRSSTFTVGRTSGRKKSDYQLCLTAEIVTQQRYLLVREDLWLLLEEEKLVLVRRLPPPLRLTLGRFEGMTARDSGGGGGGTRDW